MRADAEGGRQTRRERRAGEGSRKRMKEGQKGEDEREKERAHTSLIAPTATPLSYVSALVWESLHPLKEI